MINTVIIKSQTSKGNDINHDIDNHQDDHDGHDDDHDHHDSDQDDHHPGDFPCLLAGVAVESPWVRSILLSSHAADGINIDAIMITIYDDYHGGQ